MHVTQITPRISSYRYHLLLSLLATGTIEYKRHFMTIIKRDRIYKHLLLSFLSTDTIES